MTFYYGYAKIDGRVALFRVDRINGRSVPRYSEAIETFPDTLAGARAAERRSGELNATLT
ncbi:MAG: hypothetical protein O3A25_19615 [Acidobacteria bacterium]|nr:hypothetical protein [Acidobacteriota bacterium]